MAAICNGMFAHGGMRPYCATFLNFIGYAMGSVRLSALSKFGILYVMTHDSIGLGEDGPTHQPIETLDFLRATPNLYTLRPADGNETTGAYIIAMQTPETPSVISLSRQATPTVDGTVAEKVAFGAYVIREYGEDGHQSSAANSQHHYPTLTLVSTGTELVITLNTAKALYDELIALGIYSHVWIRVVSMPCFELFDRQTIDYQQSIFLSGSPVMSVEAAGIQSWRKYAHAPFGIDNAFGLSAPADKIYEHFGFTVTNLVQRAKDVITYYTVDGQRTYAPSLLSYPRFPVIAPLHH
jgi:transketolase